MATVRDLIADSLKDLGAIGISETPTSAEAEDALRTLNQLLGTWRTESLMTYARNEEVFTYLPGQQSYTIGVGGDFNTTRPVRIDGAYARDQNGNDLDIYVCRSFQDYADIVSKNATSTLITAIYYDPTYPLGTIYVWPVMTNSSYSLVLWTWNVLAEYIDIDETISLPPGYERAMRSNLAVELSPRYGREPNPILLDTAQKSKDQLKRVNADIPTLSFDRGLGGAGVTFNYLTGTPT